MVALVRAGGYRKMKKKSWRGVGGEGAAPPPQCTRCKECIADVDLEVLRCCCCCCCPGLLRARF